MSDFADFARSQGLIIDHLPYGKITRCKTETHRTKRNGAFMFAGEWGWVQNWQHHDKPIIWKAKGIQETPELRQRIKQSQQEYRQERADSAIHASKKANWILSQCRHDISSYLARKGFPDTSANMWFKEGEQPLVVIPMMLDKKIMGCQIISEDGSKKFLKGQITKGAYFQIGQGENLFYTEGYASGLSLQKILQALKISHRIIIAFSAGNIAYLAKKRNGFIVSDNDKSGTGERVARESGCKWWMPPVVGYDINDYHMHAGIFKVMQEIKKEIYKDHFFS